MDTLSSDSALGAKLIFIEVIVNDPETIEANICAKLSSKGEKATNGILAEYKKRITHYGRSFVTLQNDGSEDDLSYIKLVDYGKTVVTNRMHGYLRMRIAQFLTTVHTTPHVIYLSRHGQSEYNVLGKIGGNPPLSEAGEEYARRLGAWVPGNVCKKDGVTIKARLWTSSLQRTILTAQHIPHPLISSSDAGGNSEDASTAEGGDFEPEPDEEIWEQMSPRVYRNLDEIFAGECEGMRYEDIKKAQPEEATLRKMDKIGYRYPRGESYFDILQRLDPLIHEMESYHQPLLIVSHQAVLRLVYSYLLCLPRSRAPRIEIPLHTVMKITWNGWHPPTEERTYLGPAPLNLVGTVDDGQQNL